MFKNLLFFRFDGFDFGQHDKLAQFLETNRFVPCTGSQEKSFGWLPPRNHSNSELFEIIASHLIFKYSLEIKVIPASVIKRKVDERMLQIESSTGRKPGKKEIRDLRDEVRLSLVPLAFTKVSTVWVWFDLKNNFLALDVSSAAQADEVISLLTKTFDSLAIHQINTHISPSVAMSEWLSVHQAPVNMSIDKECELKSVDESKAAVRYTRHSLDSEEIVKHISTGKQPTRLALSWQDRVSFVLTEGLHIKKISFKDMVFEDYSSGKEDVKDDSFDTDAAIATGELCQLFSDILQALGGELSPP